MGRNQTTHRIPSVYGHEHNYSGEKQTANTFSFLVFS